MRGQAAETAGEDIETVLGRFQAWAGSRESKAARDGVREISYEEALESSRYRWRKYGESAAAGYTDGRLRAETGVVPIASPAPPPVPEVVPETDPEAEFRAESTGSGEAEAAVLSATTLPDAENSPRQTARIRKAPRRKQHFHAILAQSVGGVIPGAGPKADMGVGMGISPGDSLARSWAGEERQVSMSLRVAASEQALIKVRAAEAGVSASAYLRQCALEVEILRAQVQQFLAVSSRRRTAELRDEPRTAAPGEREGWLSRLKRRIWGKPSTQLSLKA
jgi:hypothetical protein